MVHNGPVPMRTDCKHYESRTYTSGEVVRKCRLDLAPEAPWRCPEDCPAFVKRRVDAGWQYGSLADTMARNTDEPPGLDQDAAAILDEAEDIVNAAGPEILSEVSTPKKRRLRLPGRGKKGKRKKRRKR